MTSALSRSLLGAAAALVLAACGSVEDGPVKVAADDPPTSVGFDNADLGCPDHLDDVVALLSSGLPTYDYDPAPDVAALVARTDVVLAGRLLAAERVSFELHGDSLDQSTVVVVGPDTDVLVGNGVGVTEFDVDSLWPTGVGPDPLENAIELIDVRFVAFLHEFPDSTNLTVDVQGLFVACGDGSFEAVIQPAPPGSGGTVDELVAAVRASAAEPVPIDRQVLGVEYYGACGNEVLRFGDETWYPLQWDEQRSFDVERYTRPDWSASGPQGLAQIAPSGPQGLAQIAPPGPGDDVGTLFVYVDGFARFVSDSGLIDLLMTQAEQTYEWEC